MHITRAAICLGALLFLPALVQAQTTVSACQDTSPVVQPGPFTVTCGNKTDCGMADTLEVRGANAGDAGPAAVCLRVADDATLDLRRRTVSVDASAAAAAAASAPPASPAASVSMATLLREGLEGPGAAALVTALKRSTDARVSATLMMLDDRGHRSEASLRLETSALWTSGLLKLQAEKADCDGGCHVGARLSVSVPGLAAWSAATKADPNKLVLVINDVRMAGLAPVWKSAEDTLSFKLARLGDKADNVAAWTAVLEDLLSDESRFKVGLADEKSVVTTTPAAAPFKPWVRSRGAAMVGTLVVLAMLVGLWGRNNKWSWIRDDDYGVPKAVFDPQVEADQRPFSLGRSQMPFWTFAVTAAMLAIGMTTGDWLSVNETALMLLGLGVGTALGSIAAGTPKTIEDALKVYNAAAQGSQAQIDAKAALRSLVISRKNWFKDIWSDYGDSRAGVHRLQSLLATFGFGLAFVYLAYSHGTMATFSGTQLALLGISGSAYVGFKLAGKPV